MFDVSRSDRCSYYTDTNTNTVLILYTHLNIKYSMYVWYEHNVIMLKHYIEKYISL